MNSIKIDKYITELGPRNQILYFAVKGKNKYPMPACYADMYDDEHLAIKEKEMEMPELYDTDAKHYIPLRTASQATPARVPKDVTSRTD